MKILFFNRRAILSIVLSVCILISCFQFAAMIFATTLPDDNVFYGDDFESATYTGNVWETTATVASPPAIVNGTLSFANASTNTYTVKDAYMPTNKIIKTINFEVTAAAAPTSMIYLYYNKANGAYAGLNMISGGGHTQIQLVNDTSKLSMTPASGTYIMNNYYAPYGNVIKVSVNYTYNIDTNTNAINSITTALVLKYIKIGDSAETTYNWSATITPLASQAALIENFKFAFQGTYHSPVSFDNVAVTYSQTPAVESSQFKTTYSRVLALNTSNVTSADVSDIDTALTAYNSLTSAAKGYLTAEKVLLDSLIVAASYPNQIFTGDDFSRPNLTNAAWETTAAVAVPPEISNGILSLANASANTFTVKDAYMPSNRHLETLNFEVTATAAPNMNVNLYYNKANNAYAGLYLVNGGGHIQIQWKGDTTKLTMPESGSYIMNTTHPDYGSTIKVSVTYTYNIDANTNVINSIALGVTFKFVKSGDTSETITNWSSTITPLAGQDALINNFKFAIQSTYHSPVYFDNFATTFSKTADEKAADFRTEFSDVLALTPATVQSSDFLRVNAAIGIYDGLPENIKALLTSEKALLDSLKELIEGITIECLSDNFNNGAGNWEAGNSLSTASILDKDGKNSAGTADTSDQALVIPNVSQTFYKISGWPKNQKISRITGSALLNSSSGTLYFIYRYVSNTDYSGFAVTMKADGTVTTQTFGTNETTKTQPYNFYPEESFKLGSWQPFILDYTETQCKLTLAGRSILTASIPKGGIDMGKFAIMTSVSSKQYYDNIKIEFDKTYIDDAIHFKNIFSDVLALTPQTATTENKERISAAKEAFNQLSQKTKKLLKAEKEILDSLVLSQKYGVISKSDYSKKFTDDFNNGTEKWVETDPMGYTGGYSVVDDPDTTAAGNKVLKLGEASTFLVPNSYFSPEKATINTISYKLWMPKDPNAFRPLWIVTSYVDDLNYSGYNIFLFGTKTYIRSCNVQEGVSTTSQKAITYESQKWYKVNITYTSGKSTLLITDSENNTISNMSVQASPAGKFALGIIGSQQYSGNTAIPYYVDDISVSYVKGDYDENENVSKIYAYYSGNTFLNPGDIALISGEKLKNTVSDVYIMPLSNNAGTQAGYINEPKANSIMADHLTVASTPTWDDSLATKMSIIQWTPDSLKFVIPESFSPGVYAVKLKAKVLGEQDVILYLNNPEISSTMGNEGEISTQGGWLRVIGSNLVPQQNDSSHVTFRLKSVSSGTEMVLPISQVYNDMYSLKVNIPNNLAVGSYEIYVHNGYGDTTAWSEPVSIKIGVSPRDSWPKTVFNVKSFGALGDDTTNDTPAIVKALEAAANNGGGIVYFPTGIYRVIHTLVIPQNVVIKGDGKTASSILWTSETWQYNNVPKTLVYISSNVEICDIGLHGSRSKSIISTYEDNSTTPVEDQHKNVYIHDVRICFYQSSGILSGGGSGGGPTSLKAMTSIELMNVYQQEAKGVNYIKIYGTNIQISSIFMLLENYASGTPRIDIISKYLQADHNDLTTGWMRLYSSRSLIFEDNHVGPVSTMAITGNGAYFARNIKDYQDGNNREGFTTDGQPFARDLIVKFVGQDTSIMGVGKTDFNTYSVSKSFKTNELVGKTVFVATGQGSGQYRTIVSNSGTIFKVNEPFALSPNRNSRITIIQACNDQFYIKNTFSNCRAFGTYTSMINTVFDGNLLDYFGDQNFDCNFGGVWYDSVINETHQHSDSYIHGEGIGVDGFAAQFTGKGSIRLEAIKCAMPGAYRGFLIKNNRMLDNSYIYIGNGAIDESMRDIIVEKNYIEKGDAAFVSGIPITGVDGITLYKNTYGTNKMVSGGYFDSIGTSLNVNRAYDKKIIVLGEITTSAVWGDVNLDGTLSLKDSTLIRYYLVGMVQLTAEQLRIAEVSGDGVVTLKDANLIRKAVAGVVS